MKISELKTNQLNNPLGYDFSFLNISWKIKETTAHFTAKVRVKVWIGENTVVHDTGIMNDFHQCELSLKLNLLPRTRYYWQVWAMDDAGDECTSDVAWFETAKMEEPWRAEWISPVEETEEMPVLSKKFTISGEVDSARIYLYGLGLYELYVNGQKAEDEYLKPGYHSYDSRMEYQTIDLSTQLVVGENQLEILLGEGWYKGRFGFDGVYTNLYGNRKKCIAEAVITYRDGRTEYILTDKTWKARTGRILSNNIYDGESIDETRVERELEVEQLDDTKSLLCERTNPPVRKVTCYKPVEVQEYPDGYTLLDFGKTITGWVEATGEFDAGQTILLQYGELLQDGRFYRDNLRTAKAEFRFTAKGGYEEMIPHFTYFGFRYVKITGLKKDQNLDFTAYRIMSDIEKTGGVVTSDEAVNKLFTNTIRSQKCNFLDIPTDCPQRDERMGWTGDVTAFAKTACFHMNSAAFFRHYLKSVREEQKRLQGAVPFFAPLPKVKKEENTNPFYITAGACTWGDVATVLPWALYEYYGNKDMLREQYPLMCDWIDYVSGRVSQNEVPYLWQNDPQLGDWLALDNGNLFNPIGKTDAGLIASAWYFHSVCLCERAAGELEDVREKEFHELGQRIKEAFQNYYFKESGELTVEPTQTACALLLHFGLYTRQGKEWLLDTLVNLIRENGNHLNTGFVGTPVLCPALSEYGQNQLAYEMLLNKTYPGWLHEVELGATTVWERWNSLDEEGHISSTGMNSLNHYAYGSISEWLYHDVCGFQPHMQKEICMTIRPRPDRQLTYVKGIWNSPYGKCISAWKYVGETIQYHYEIPCNAQVEVILPSGYTTVLLSGCYTFNEEGEELSEEEV